MRIRRLIATAFVSLLPVAVLACATQATATPQTNQAPPAAAPAPQQEAPQGTARRVELPGGPDLPFPYTVELPAGWEMREVKDIPGIWLGPTDATPPNDPRLVYVRLSPTSFPSPEQVVANIKAADEKQPWAAPIVEPREVNGVRGVLVRMDSGEGDAARSTLVLKLPLEKGSVDFMGSASRAEFDKLRPAYEQVLFSVRPRDENKTEKRESKQ